MARARQTEYNDDYPTCAVTHVTLRVSCDDLDPDAVSHLLDVEPSTVNRLGDTQPSGAIFPPAWFLKSEGRVTSRDSRRHLDWLLDSMSESGLSALTEQGTHVTVSCYWVSKSGHGGPTLSQYQIERLGRLGLPISFDIYFPSKPAAEVLGQSDAG